MRTKRARLYSVGDYWLVPPGVPKHDPPYRDYGICWHDAAARQTRRLGTGETDLEDAKDAIKNHALTHGDGTHKDELVLQSLERYYLAYASKLPCAKNVKQTIDYVAQFWPTVMVSQADAGAQKALVANLRNLGMSDSTIARHFSMIVPAISYAIQFKHLPASLEFIRLAKRHWGMRTQPVKRKSISATKRQLSPQEWGRLFDTAMVRGEHCLRYLICAIATHARPSANVQLTGIQIDLEHETVDLNQPGRVQSKKRRPIVPMAPTFAKWLRAWDVPPNERVMLSKRGRPLRGHRFVERLIADAQVPDCTAYTFRHAVASWLAGAGIDKWERKAFLGHAVIDGGSTDDYTHYDPRYLRNAAMAIERLFEAIAEHTRFNLLRRVVEDQGDPAVLWESLPVGFCGDRAATRLHGAASQAPVPEAAVGGDTEGAGSRVPRTGTAHPPLTQTISLSYTPAAAWELRGSPAADLSEKAMYSGVFVTQPRCVLNATYVTLNSKAAAEIVFPIIHLELNGK
jgi:integrase